MRYLYLLLFVCLFTLSETASAQKVKQCPLENKTLYKKHLEKMLKAND